jgi:hypothetical protein
MAKTTTKTTVENDIVDIDLSTLRKKRFRIDGDNDRILELNTSDVGIISRLTEGEKKLNELMTKVYSASSSDDENSELDIDKMGTTIDEVDKEMREVIDMVFDSNVSEVCAPFGNMYDFINGGFRYETIINTLLQLYETNISKETAKMRKRIQQHTDKYTKK